MEHTLHLDLHLLRVREKVLGDIDMEAILILMDHHLIIMDTHLDLHIHSCLPLLNMVVVVIITMDMNVTITQRELASLQRRSTLM
jgi:hypothetical protein